MPLLSTQTDQHCPISYALIFSFIWWRYNDKASYLFPTLQTNRTQCHPRDSVLIGKLYSIILFGFLQCKQIQTIALAPQSRKLSGVWVSLWHFGFIIVALDEVCAEASIVAWEGHNTAGDKLYLVHNYISPIAARTEETLYGAPSGVCVRPALRSSSTILKAAGSFPRYSLACARAMLYRTSSLLIHRLTFQWFQFLCPL